MTNYEVDLTKQDPFAGFQPPIEFPYIPLTTANEEELARRHYDEALMGTNWLSLLCTATDQLAECDLADRQGVRALEYQLLHAAKSNLGIDQPTADNVHTVFGEAYGDQRKHVDPAEPDAEMGSVSGIVRLFKLPNGRVLLTSTNYQPISDEALAELRDARHAPLNARLLDRAQQGSSVDLDEASHPDAALTAEQVQNALPDLDLFEEDGRGSGMTAVLAEDAGIARVLDARGKLGVCHWYLVRDGRDTATEKLAAHYYSVA